MSTPQLPRRELAPGEQLRRRLRLGCLGVLAVLVLLVVGLVLLLQLRARRAEERQEQIAQQTFTPVLQRLEEARRAAAGVPAGAQDGSATAGSGRAGAAPSPPGYDIDRTVQVLHEVDAALQQQGSLREYLFYMAQQDYRGVAPEV
ncbi:MAG: hypothetical protein FJ125_05575, partial [Deltaproteobacteria bacterium]|nr:hypothetical protein [Deltaproteobacteria bacterium]